MDKVNKKVVDFLTKNKDLIKEGRWDEVFADDNPYALNTLKEVSEAFNFCSTTILDILSKMTYVPAGACIGSKIVQANIPDNIIEIGDYAFAGCSQLKRVKLPNNLRAIGDGAFEECSSLKEINLPDSVENIGEEIFFHCDNLETITVPDDLETEDYDNIRDGNHASIFYN